MANPIRLLCSPDPLAIQAEALQEVARGVKDWPLRRAFVVVPEFSKVDTERLYFTETKMTSLLMAEVLSFHRLAHRVFNETGGLAANYISDSGKKLLIQNLLLDQDSKQLNWLKKLAKAPLFVETITATLKEFKNFGITDGDLRQTALQADSKINHAKLVDFADLSEMLLNRTTALNLYDRDDDINRASALITAQPLGKRLQFLKNAVIWVVGYGGVIDFNAQDLDLIAALHQVGASITVTLASEHEPLDLLQCDNSSKNKTNTARQLARIGELEIITVADRRKPVFAALANGYNSTIAKQAEATEVISVMNQSDTNVRVIQAISREQELAYVAGEIVRLTQQKGVALDEIAIALFDSSKPAQVKAIMSDYGLRINLDEQITLETSEWQRWLMTLLQMISGQSECSKLFAWLHSGLCGKPENQIDDFCNLCKARGVKQIFQLSSGKYSDDLHKHPVFCDVVSPLLGWLRQNERGQSGTTRFQLLLQFIEQSNVLHHVEERWSYWQEKHPEFAVKLQQALNFWQSFVGEAEMLMPTEPINARCFADMIMVALGERVRPIPHSAKSVRIASPEALRQHPCSYLFLTGLTALTMTPQLANETLLNDVERESIANNCSKFFPANDKSAVAKFETTLQILLGLPQKGLYLMSPTLDKELQAPVVTWLKAITSVWQKQIFGIDLPDVRWLLDPKSNRLATYIKKSTSFNKLAPELQQGFLDQLPRFDKSARDGALVLPSMSVFADEMTEVLRSRSLSVSQLEKYANCPYSWFVSNLLRLQETPVESMRSYEIGTILHAVMFEFFCKIKDAQVRGQEFAVPTLTECENQLVQKMVAKGWRYGQNGAPDYMVGRHSRRLATILHEVIASEIEYFKSKEAQWQIDSLECNFVTEIMAGDAQPSIKIRGQIDRVDLGEARFRIVDYKSSQKVFDALQLEYGLMLQMPIYAYAWQKEAERNISCAEFAYVTLANDTNLSDALIASNKNAMRKRVTTLFQNEAESTSVMAKAEQKVVELAAQIRSGAIDATPLELKGNLPCKYCMNKALCGYDHRAIKSRKRIVKNTSLAKNKVEL